MTALPVGAVLGLLLLSQPLQANPDSATHAEPATGTEKALGLTMKAAPNRFGSLVDAADYYAQLPAAGWRVLDDGPALKPGQRHPQIAQLRQLLSLYGDYRLPPKGRIDLKAFDRRLARALMRFQQRNGLHPDAVLGPNTRLALNVAPDVRVFQLLLNHERQLALKKRRAERYIQVNLPEFQLRLFEGDTLQLEMKTIVGRKSRSTPILESEIRSLLLNPPWNVPRSIAEKDLLPKWQADEQFLTRHNLRIVSGWGADKVWVDPAQTSPDRLYKGREYQRLYQMPGRYNALGQIKFDSPNSRAIYLHDTPSKSLFMRQQRAFSSGCVRVENPRLLASYLLQTQPLEQPLAELLEQSETRRIPLQKPISLYLTYWTAWLDPQHRLQFREDIYQRDAVNPPALVLSGLTQEQSDGQENL